jgi:transposase
MKKYLRLLHTLLRRRYNWRVLDINALPNTTESLKRLVIEQHRQIEHLKFQLAKLRRFRFGQSSEKLEGLEQMVLHLEELEAGLAQQQSLMQPTTADTAEPVKGQPVRRKQFPEHFERNENRIEPKECACPECGGPLGSIGKPDTAEVLEVKAITFTVTRHIRPKKRCSKCSVILQAPAPSRPIEKSFAGASLLALVLGWKYAECRYRHSAYYAAVRTMQVNSVQSSKNMGFTSVYSVSSSA